MSLQLDILGIFRWAEAEEKMDLSWVMFASIPLIRELHVKPTDRVDVDRRSHPEWLHLIVTNHASFPGSEEVP